MECVSRRNKSPDCFRDDRHFSACARKMAPPLSFFSTKPRSTFHVPRSTLFTAPVAQPCPRIGQTGNREIKKRVGGATLVISRCNRYDLSPGVVRHLRARRARWMVNVKPRVSLAWPSRRLDHNAWSCRSQADYNHGDPTFYRHRGSLLPLSRYFASGRARLFPLNQRPLPPLWISFRRFTNKNVQIRLRVFLFIIYYYYYYYYVRPS